MLIELNQIDDVCVIRCEGRFVTGVEPEFLRAKMDELKRLGCAKVLVDFRGVISVGSTAIGFIVAIYSSVTKSPDGRFVLVGSQPRVPERCSRTSSGATPRRTDSSAPTRSTSS